MIATRKRPSIASSDSAIASCRPAPCGSARRRPRAQGGGRRDGRRPRPCDTPRTRGRAERHGSSARQSSPAARSSASVVLPTPRGPESKEPVRRALRDDEAGHRRESRVMALGDEPRPGHPRGAPAFSPRRCWASVVWWQPCGGWSGAASPRCGASAAGASATAGATAASVPCGLRRVVARAASPPQEPRRPRSRGVAGACGLCGGSSPGAASPPRGLR